MRKMNILSKWFGKSQSRFLDRALCAYVATFPDSERLETHLKRVGRLGDFAQTRSILDDALSAGYAYVTSNASSVDWNSEDFEHAFGKHLRSGYPWLGDDGLDCIRSYCMYLCWKDGYDFSRHA